MQFDKMTTKQKRSYILEMAHSNNVSRNQLKFIKGIIGLMTPKMLDYFYLSLKERGFH